MQVIEFTYARMVELVDTRDLKSRGSGRVRAGSSPAPGTKINDLAPVRFRSLRTVCPYCNQLRLIFENCKRRLKRSRAGKAVGYLFGSLLGALMAILTLSAARRARSS